MPWRRHRNRLIIDSGAVIGWSRADPRVRAIVREALERPALITS